MNLKDKRYIWIILALTALLLRVTLPAAVIEIVYSRGLFLVFRWVWDYTFALLPFPLIAAFWIGVFYYLGKHAVLFVRQFKRQSWLLSLKSALLSLTAFVSALVFFFLVLWGFNYGRIPLETQLQLNVQPLDSVMLAIDARNALQYAQTYRAQIPNTNDSTALSDDLLPAALESTMRNNLVKALTLINYPTAGRVRCWQLLPKGILLRLGISGIYFPFIGEGHMDDGLTSVEKPFVMAHELSHGYGITGEGDCNFLGYLACTQSEDPFVQYSGALEYLRYVAGEYRESAPYTYQAFKASLPKGIRADIRHIYANYDKYPSYWPGVTEQINNAYLKTQGVREGIKSYDRVTMLIHAYLYR